MLTGTFCAKCGQPIRDEAPSGSRDERKPCTKCGSTARTFSVSLSATVAVSVTVEGEMAGYPRSLLDMAKTMIDSGTKALASMGAVLCHTACEIGTERAISSALRKRGIEDLQEAILPQHRGYSLKNDNLCKLYVALTGDDIRTRPFWQRFRLSADRRDDIIHGGKFVTQAEANESHKAATELLAHLAQL